MPKITDQQLQTYFAQGQSNLELVYNNGMPAFQNMNDTNRHPVFMETVLQYYPLKVHADGLFPKAMISMRRPSESDEILEYRQNTYKPITKLPVSKVITSLSKIRRSQDWTINFDDQAVPPKIVPEESLEEYCSKNIPGYGSITDWAFSILLKQQAIDANAVVAVLPLTAADSNEYLKPVPIVFNSDHVLEFDEAKQIAILKSRKKINMILEDGSTNYNSGNRFYYIDDQEFIIYDQTVRGFVPTFEMKHTLGKMPCFKLKGEAFKQYDNLTVNRSRLDAMIAFLDEAACEYSDLKASKIQNLFPLFWYYQNKNCNACGGKGKVINDADKTVECTSCGGSGKVKFSPFAHMQVDPAGIGQQQNPMPPAGYIQRDTEILKLQEESVEKNIYKSLSAINMQFLDQTPLNISGEAKNVDREELNNFVYNFAEDLIAAMDRAIYFINEWRYNYIVPDKIKREAMLPDIPVPMNFDLLPADYLMNEITAARNNKVNPFLLATLEQQLAKKKFYNDPDLADRIELFFDLDPLAGMSTDEKVTLLGNNGITEEDFVISSNLSAFIRRALKEDPQFMSWDYQKQIDLMAKYAQEKLKVNNTAQQMIDAQKQKVLAEMAANNPNGQQVNGQNPPDPNAANPDTIDPNKPAGIPKVPISITGNKPG